MNAGEVMTRKVVTVTPETLVRDVARLLLEHRISAVPVLHDRRIRYRDMPSML